MITVTLAELAEALDYAYAGDANTPVCRIAFAEEAHPGELAICRSKKEVTGTLAEADLLPPKNIKTKKTLLYSVDPLEVGAVRAAQALIAFGLLTDYRLPDHYASCGQWMAGQNCSIGPGTNIGPCCVIGSRTTIGADCVIEPQVWIGADVEIGDRVHIRAGAKIGVPAFYHYRDETLCSFPGVGTVRISDDVEIGSQCVIQRGTFSDTRVGEHTMLGDLVTIGHDVHIGSSCKIVAQSGLAGNVTIGDNVLIYGQAGIANYVKIGDWAVVMAKTLVSKDVFPGETVMGPFGRKRMEELRFQIKLKKIIGGR